jgi:hypothetical protein
MVGLALSRTQLDVGGLAEVEVLSGSEFLLIITRFTDVETRGQQRKLFSQYEHGFYGLEIPIKNCSGQFYESRELIMSE